MRACLCLVVAFGPLTMPVWGQVPSSPSSPYLLPPQVGRPVQNESVNDRIVRLVRTITNKGEAKLVREDAVRELVRITPPHVRVPVLLALLKAEDRDTVVPYGPVWTSNAVQPGFVRYHVVLALMSLSPQEVRAATSALIDRMLRDEVADVRAGAAWALSRIARADDAVIGAFIRVLRSEDVPAWEPAAFGLGEAGGRAAVSRSELNKLAAMGEPRGTDARSIAQMNATIAARQALLKIDRSMEPPSSAVFPPANSDRPSRVADLLGEDAPQPPSPIPGPYEGPANPDPSGVNKILDSSLGSINESYRGMHPYFNDDVVGSAVGNSVNYVIDRVGRSLGLKK